MRSLLACLALAGCGASLPRAPSLPGPCLQLTATGGGKRWSQHYWKNGHEITNAELDATLAQYPPSRDEAQLADRTARAGWWLLIGGGAIALAGMVTSFALAPPHPGTQKGPPWWPGFGIALGGEALGIGGLIGTGLAATRERHEAVALYNRHADHVGCNETNLLPTP